MHARIVSLKGSPERADDAIKVIQDQVIPQVQQMPGFVGGYWLLDRKSGKAHAVTLFDSEKSLADTRGMAQQVRERGSQAAGSTIEGVEEMEVMFSVQPEDKPGCARLVKSDGPPEAMDKALDEIREVPAREFSSFQGGFWLGDRKTGQGRAIIFYRSQKDLDEIRERANTANQEMADRLGFKSSPAEEYEIVAVVPLKQVAKTG